MFKKVLIAEDHESSNISIRKTLEELGIPGHTYVYYCDDALRELQQAVGGADPFELLITDLSFDPDGREQKLPSGEALIQAARALQPSLKILVFSFDKRPAVIEGLSKGAGVNGYVLKGRHDAQELKLAVANLFENRKHFPAQAREAARLKNAHDFTPFDILIIRLLSQGMLQKEIPAYLQANEIRPSSLSSLEKRLNLIREAYDFSNNEQLVIFCKDMGLI